MLFGSGITSVMACTVRRALGRSMAATIPLESLACSGTLLGTVLTVLDLLSHTGTALYLPACKFGKIWSTSTLPLL